MGNTKIMLPIGAIDGRSAVAKASRADSQEQEVDAVAAALSMPVRGLIAAVLAVNLSLGAWLVSSSDFTDLKPQGSAAYAQARATDDLTRAKTALRAEASDDQGRALKVADANDRE